MSLDRPKMSLTLIWRAVKLEQQEIEGPDTSG